MKVKSWLFLDISEKSDLGDWAGHRQREKPACWKHSQHGQVWSIYRSDLFDYNMDLPIQEVLGKVHASARLSPPLPHCWCMWLVDRLWLVTGWVKASKPMFLLMYVMNFHCKILTEWINVKNYCLGEHNQRVDQALVSRQIRACSKVNQQLIWLECLRSTLQLFRKDGGHRALGDIQDSIEELKYYRRTVFKQWDQNFAAKMVPVLPFCDGNGIQLIKPHLLASRVHYWWHLMAVNSFRECPVSRWHGWTSLIRSGFRSSI